MAQMLNGRRMSFEIPPGCSLQVSKFNSSICARFDLSFGKVARTPRSPLYTRLFSQYSIILRFRKGHKRSSMQLLGPSVSPNTVTRPICRTSLLLSRKFYGNVEIFASYLLLVSDRLVLFLAGNLLRRFVGHFIFGALETVAKIKLLSLPAPAHTRRCIRRLFYSQGLYHSSERLRHASQRRRLWTRSRRLQSRKIPQRRKVEFGYQRTINDGIRVWSQVCIISEYIIRSTQFSNQ